MLVGRTENTNVMRVNGWVNRKTFKEECVAQDFGYGERLMMEHDKLFPIETFWKQLMETKFKGE